MRPTEVGAIRRVTTPPAPPLTELAPPALVDGDHRMSADDVRLSAQRLAAGLTARGVGRGDVVAMQLPNWWEAVVVFHACWSLGAIVHPIHHRAGTGRRAELLARSDPRVTFIADDLPPSPGAIPVRGAADGFGALLQTPAAAPSPPVAATDVAVLLATSGSTARPKLVRHLHGALHHKARVMREVHGLTPDDVVLMPAPLSHISGLLNGVLLPGAAGMRSVLMDRWVPGRALELIAHERVTFMIGPPTFFIDLAAEPGCEPRTVASVRQISTGGAGVTPTFVDQATATFGAWVKRTYGSTEAPTVTSSHVGDPRDRARDTDGRPTGDVELRVIDPRSAEPVPPGQPGELLVRGSEVFAGYTDAHATASALDAEGWFHTGDLATVDDAGWLTIVGRLSDTIIRGGENIGPSAVEAACAALPHVRQVAVVGVPDARLGERVALVVEADTLPTRHEVHAACAAAGLETFAYPERVVRVDAMPVLDAGKPDRALLTSLAAEAGELL